jgi:predicted component of viral defense system (DUF524 family)
MAFQQHVSIRVDTPALNAPLRELPFLYQLWATMHVIRELLDVGGELGYVARYQRLIGKDARGLFVRALPDGRPAVELEHPQSGRTVRLVPEQSYPAARGAPAGLHSITYSQRPDVAIEVCHPDGEIEVLIFDPKYKVESFSRAEDRQQGNGDGKEEWIKPIKGDIDKMHTYRDAIRDSSRRRVVTYAAILYPGPTVRFAGGIAALGAQPMSKSSFSADTRRVLNAALSGQPSE